MGKSLLDLARTMNKKVVVIEKAASLASAKAAIAIVRDLVENTPVDTSTALSNWQLVLLNPASNSRDAFVQGQFGSSAGQSASAAIKSAESTLRKKKPGQPIYISNLLDYINNLNEGSSRQAPAGFVERAILIGRRTAKLNFKV